MLAGQQITPTLKLVRPLAEGAMGSVWIAEHLTLGVQVAVKFMSPTLAADTELVARFQQEARAAATIRSPHVAQVFDHGVTDEGSLCIVMELLEGETLGRRVTRLRRLPVDEVVHIVSQAARGLGKAHRMGIVHRDVKPDNLFLTDLEGELFVKVLDFGVAKRHAGEGNPEITATGIMLGTPLYMSPEQFVSAKRATAQSDLWGLAAVTYYALTGKTPFAGKSLGALAVAVNEGVFLPPRQLRPELPVGIDEWMAKALKVKPAERFGSAAEMVDALVVAVQGTRGARASMDSDANPTTGLHVPGPMVSGALLPAPLATTPLAAAPVATAPPTMTPLAAAPVATAQPVTTPFAGGQGAPPAMRAPSTMSPMAARGAPLTGRSSLPAGGNLGASDGTGGGPGLGGAGLGGTIGLDEGLPRGTLEGVGSSAVEVGTLRGPLMAAAVTIGAALAVGGTVVAVSGLVADGASPATSATGGAPTAQQGEVDAMNEETTEGASGAMGAAGDGGEAAARGLPAAGETAGEGAAGGSGNGVASEGEAGVVTPGAQGLVPSAGGRAVRPPPVPRSSASVAPARPPASAKPPNRSPRTKTRRDDIGF
ncbi:serine/threonine-protein kinase [Chondromyces crocatus]|uniref:Protein kinase domain-containing protein n=1 Tax=Chondromyces crocatus TaxID=52 RepID=A0A0K1EEB8_CHOCO|nr:serine/threonine-protein kinase [Chondromyces crocatus]AKT39194.1 uncharacterized protein CMC5_033430 [Chondromyces crocatus]